MPRSQTSTRSYLSREFLPDTGTILYLKTPSTTLRDCKLRVETGIREKDEVSVYYDPMISKLVVHGPNRDIALYGMLKALEDYHIVGLSTNIDFLKRLASHPSFIKGDVETGFIEKHRKQLFPIENIDLELASAQVALFLASKTISEPYSLTRHFSYQMEISGQKVSLEVEQMANRFNVIINGISFPFSDVNVKYTESSTATNLCCHSEKGKHSVTVVEHPYESSMDSFTLFDNSGKQTLVKVLNPEKKYSIGRESSEMTSSDIAKSPMPSRISAILAKQGETVKKGTTLMVLEAMKMEHAIKAPRDGKIQKIISSDAIGSMIHEGHVLFQLEPLK